jgi:F0F1-type ATP synthase assembly protein I
MPGRPPSPRELGFYVTLAQVALEMVFPLGVGIALDSLFDWHPWATVGGFAFGFIGGFAHLMVLVKQHDDAERSKPGRDEQ